MSTKQYVPLNEPHHQPCDSCGQPISWIPSEKKWYDACDCVQARWVRGLEPACDGCGEMLDGNHPMCEVAAEFLQQGFCGRCGVELDGTGIPAEHDDCVLEEAAIVRPGLLEPLSAEERAALERLGDAIEAEMPELERRQQAPWN